jgi:hypothetical protein
MQAITLNGATIGYETLGGALYRNVPPGHYAITAPSFIDNLDPSQTANVDLAAGQQAYLKLDSIWWPNGGGENMVPEFYVRLMPPQAARTAIAQLACSHPSPAAPEVRQGMWRQRGPPRG